MQGRLGVLVVVVAALGCGETGSGRPDAGPADAGGQADYLLSILCLPSYAGCPEGQPCPTVPVGTDAGCDELPTWPFDVPAGIGDAGPAPGYAFPNGCQIKLPGHDLYGSQATCTCGGYWGGYQYGSWVCPN